MLHKSACFLGYHGRQPLLVNKDPCQILSWIAQENAVKKEWSKTHDIKDKAHT